MQHLAAGEADLIAAASLAFLASSTLPRGLDGSYSSDDDEVCLTLPPQRKQGFERACCAERIDYTTIKKHLLEAEECQRASQRYRSSSFQSTGAPSSMHASADRFDANGSDAGNPGSDDTITGAHATAHGEEQRPGDAHGVGVAGSTDEPRGSGGSDGTARPPSSDDAPDAVKEEDGGVHQTLTDAPSLSGLKVAADVQELRTLRMELLQGLALHTRGLRAPAAELRVQVLLCSLQQRSVSPQVLRELQLVQVVQQLEQHASLGVQQAAQQLLQGAWREYVSTRRAY